MSLFKRLGLSLITLLQLNSFVLLPMARAEVTSYNFIYPDDTKFPDPELAPDSSVFDIVPKPLPPNDSKGHYYTRYPKYSAAQRSNWIRECDHLKDSNFRKFQECYREHKGRTLHPERVHSAH